MSDMHMPPPQPDDQWGHGHHPPPPPPPVARSLSAGPERGWAEIASTGEQAQLAGAGMRLLARILDGAILAVALVVLWLVVILGASGIAQTTISINPAGDNLGVAAMALLIFGGVVTVLIALLYEVAFTAIKGQTLGKMVTGIRVVRADNGGIPGWGKSALRWVVPTGAGLVPFVGWLLSLLVYLALTWDPLRQGWHDKAASTMCTL